MIETYIGYPPRKLREWMEAEWRRRHPQPVELEGRVVVEDGRPVVEIETDHEGEIVLRYEDADGNALDGWAEIGRV